MFMHFKVRQTSSETLKRQASAIDTYIHTCISHIGTCCKNIDTNVMEMVRAGRPLVWLLHALKCDRSVPSVGFLVTCPVWHSFTNADLKIHVQNSNCYSSNRCLPPRKRQWFILQRTSSQMASHRIIEVLCALS